MVRVRIDLGYDGSAFAGWALQPGQRTVAGELAGALRVVARLLEPPRLVVAGRTDAGVHARGQVAHVDLSEPSWNPISNSLADRLNGVLPRDIRVRRAVEAPAGFDARFSAQWRRYAYRVFDRPGTVDPLIANFVVPVPWQLDLAAMNRAGAQLLGLNDFAAFCRYREGATTIRHLVRLEWRRSDEFAELTVVADAFCHGMVRSLVGSLLPVGSGRRPEAWPLELMRAGAREPTVMAADPAGLVLEEIGYPPDDGLEMQAELTRRRRQ